MKTEQEELNEAVDQAIFTTERLVEKMVDSPTLAKNIARLARKVYDELIIAGFTEAQALILSGNLGKPMK